MKSVYLCLILVLAIACFGYADIIYVPGDYPTIQAGIDAASDGDTVLVADGTYTGEGNKDLDFKGKAITVTSENGAEHCIIDCQGEGRGFYFQNGEAEASVVSGFTITNGFDSDGGGIYCYYSSPTIENNIIAKNSADDGGGICCNNSSSIIQNNEISGNSAGIFGGGVYCGESSPTITNNTIENNSAESGGGIGCRNSSPMIQNDAISRNSAVKAGGGVYCEGSHLTIQNNVISGNWSGAGGGIACYDGAFPTIQNNEVSGNLGDSGGGGIYCHRESSPMIINNTISGNSAGDGSGGIYCDIFSSPTVLNTILWADSPGEIYLDGTSTIDVTYSDIQGGWEGEGNIDADPLFVDPDNDDYHLQPDSPCIDAGTPIGAPPDDIEGNPRDEFPDMGAYEYQGVSTGSIYGTVTDREGNLIKWALVIAINAETKEKYKDFTDMNSYYEILNLPPGTYLVLCIKKGYQAGIKKTEVVAGEATRVDFMLTPKLE